MTAALKLNPAGLEIVTVRGRHHLADRLSLIAWCGESLKGGLGIELLPGADLGDAKGDCQACAAKLAGGGK